MREEPASIKAWIRRDLATRYGTALSEDLPPAMIEALARHFNED